MAATCVWESHRHSTARHGTARHRAQVVIVDEFTGRTMPGRRWGDGLHQAIEAKERLPIQNETVTLASISYQVRGRSGALIASA